MRKTLLIAFILIAAIGGVWLLNDRASQEPPIQGPVMSVRFLDDTLGNALIVQSPEGHTSVVDPTARHVDALLSLLRDEQVREVSIVVTEPSFDTLSAVAELNGELQVKMLIRPDQARDAQRSKASLVRAKCAGIPETLVQPGDSVRLSPSVRMDVLGPAGEARDKSCVVRFVYRGRSVLYIAELRPEAEGALISSTARLESSVLAVGSRAHNDNPSIELLSRVRPEIAVLCSNRPPSAAISRLRRENSGATLFRTDKDGIIDIVTNGRSVHCLTGGGP